MDITRGLIADIAVQPLDDTPWLVLSDWMEEQGDPETAELLRLVVWLRQHLYDTARSGQEAQLREMIQRGIHLPLPRRRLDLGRGVDLDLVLVPPGRFLMGSPASELHRDSDEGPVHAVTISRGFWLGIHPVTQEQWQAVMASPTPGRFHGPARPVEGVSWLDCQAFLNALSTRQGVRARLPTEAEWEYACRAGTTSAFYPGGVLSSQEANFDGNWPYGGGPPGPWLEQTADVGSYPPNAWGLHDMHGNVWEWCSDWYDGGYYAHSPDTDPPGAETGSLRVIRGGSWYSYSWSCRSAGREKVAPESGAGNYGFRVVVEG